MSADGTPGSTLGWHLVEGSDLSVMAQHLAEWERLLELETYPVIRTPAEAASAASKVKSSRNISTMGV